jgi:hypothetical protein
VGDENLKIPQVPEAKIQVAIPPVCNLPLGVFLAIPAQPCDGSGFMNRRHFYQEYRS